VRRDLVRGLKEPDKCRRGLNVLATGDTFSSRNSPNLDWGSGGTIDGMIAATERYLKTANDTTKIVPGHGPLATKADLQAFHNMLVTVRDRVKKRLDEGKSEQEVLAANPIADLDAKWAAAQGLGSNPIWLPTSIRSSRSSPKLKTLLRKAAERTVEATWKRIGALLDAFTSVECANYLKNAGSKAKANDLILFGFFNWLRLATSRRIRNINRTLGGMPTDRDSSSNFPKAERPRRARQPVDPLGRRTLSSLPFRRGANASAAAALAEHPHCADRTGLPQPSGTFTSRLSTVRSPSPSLDITTTVTGLFCWRVLHPLEWQLASLHGQSETKNHVRDDGSFSRVRTFTTTYRGQCARVGWSQRAPGPDSCRPSWLDVAFASTSSAGMLPSTASEISRARCTASWGVSAATGVAEPPSDRLFCAVI
jgi:hypothetical protein